MQILNYIHSYTRWAILIVLLVVIFRHFSNKGKDFTAQDKSWSLKLLIITHLQFVIGLVQYFAGNKGFNFIKENGMKECMKNAVLRFWAVEHITAMLIAIVLITIAHSKTKKAIANNLVAKRNGIMVILIVALVVIFAAIPWPFREVVKIENIPYLRF